MISASAIESGSAATRYFDAALSTGQHVSKTDNYYVNEHAPSAWDGLGAAHAGLTVGQRVERDEFLAVLNGTMLNRATQTFQQLGRKQHDELQHRSGWDFTFSASKSISIVGLVGEDARVRQAHEAAVSAAMQYLEKYAAFTKVNNKGETLRIQTSNLVYAKFLHDTSRENDPQIHTHVIIANATYDTERQRWGSLANEKLFELRASADQVYHSVLARGLREIGYDIRFNHSGHVEIAAISQEQIDAFSKRTAQIVENLKQAGLTQANASYAAQDAATLGTRSTKVELAKEVLLDRWRNEAHGMGLDMASIVDAARPRPILGPRDADWKRLSDTDAARAAVTAAIDHLGERQAAFPMERIEAAAHRFSYGRTDGAAIGRALTSTIQDGRLIAKNIQHYTTPAALAYQSAMVRAIADGKQAVRPIMGFGEFDRELRDFEIHKTAELRTAGKLDNKAAFALNNEQRTVAAMILTTNDRHTAVQGAAGTGKTAVMEFVRMAAEHHGVEVIGIANGSAQAKNLQREAGIESRTVAAFLAAERLCAGDGHKIVPRALVIMDEAGQVGQRDMSEVMKAIEARGAQASYVGDIRQHGSVEAGRAFDQMQRAGIQLSVLKEVRRQSEQNMIGRQAVKLMMTDRKGAFAAAFAKLRPVQVAPGAAAYRTVASEYVAATSRGEQVGLLTPLNADRQGLNHAIRDELKALGALQAGMTIETLRKVDLTRTEARHVHSYRVGMKLLAERQYPSAGIAAGDVLTVVGIDRILHEVHATIDTTGDAFRFRPATRTAFAAYEAMEKEYAPGDVIAIGKNLREGRNLLARNGEKGRIESIRGDGATIRLFDGGVITLSRDQLRHTDYGYATTSYKEQGATTQRELVYLNSAASVANNRQMAYVAATRAREETRVFTDNPQAIYQQIERTSEKTVAREIKTMKAAWNTTNLARQNAMQQDAGRTPSRQALIRR